MKFRLNEINGRKLPPEFLQEVETFFQTNYENWLVTPPSPADHLAYLVLRQLGYLQTPDEEEKVTIHVTEIINRLLHEGL